MAATNPSRSPLVSVCLLNYNGGPFVRGCFEGLRGTRYTPWELIVVDNASRDGSAELVAAELERFPPSVPTRLLRLDRNMGYAGGHNAGAGQARGEFVAFLNMTSQVEPDWLEIVPWIERQPDVGFAQPLIADERNATGSRASGAGCPSRVGSISSAGSGATIPGLTLGRSVTTCSLFLAPRSSDDVPSLGPSAGSTAPSSCTSRRAISVGGPGFRVGGRCAGSTRDARVASSIGSGERDRRASMSNVCSIGTRSSRCSRTSNGAIYPMSSGTVWWSVRSWYGILGPSSGCVSELLQRLPQAARRRRQVQRERRVGDARIFGLTDPAYSPRSGTPRCSPPPIEVGPFIPRSVLLLPLRDPDVAPPQRHDR